MIDEQVKNDRFRNFLILLYTDTDTYNFDDVLFNIRNFKYYAYIKHTPETEEKKEHYHVFIHLDNATTISSIAKRLGVPENFVQNVRSVRSSCRYLTHIDYPDKIQYNLSDVIVSRIFERKFKKHFEDLETEEEIIYNIYSFIDNLKFNNYSECLRFLVIYVNSNCYDTIFRRYKLEFLDYLKQKNY